MKERMREVEKEPMSQEAKEPRRTAEKEKRGEGAQSGYRREERAARR